METFPQNSYDKERFTPIHDRVLELYHAAVARDGMPVIYDRMLEHSKYLQEKYSDWRTRAWFHAFAFSTPDSEVTNFEDFPGSDSVEQFMKDLAHKHEVSVAA